MYIQYPIIAEQGDHETAWSIYVPDIEGCFSAADDESGILENAREAVLGHLDVLGEIPKPSKLSQHLGKLKNKQYAILVDVDLSKLEGPAKRINITIPANVLNKIDLAAKTKGKSRSEFLAESALKNI
jgi:predicted RNase H-like HicB family nuclease